MNNYLNNHKYWHFGYPYIYIHMCVCFLDMTFPLFFPTDVNRQLVGLQRDWQKKFSVVFQDFGRTGHVNVECKCDSVSSGDQLNMPTIYTTQRCDLSDNFVCDTSTPILPLSSSPING